MPNHIQNRLQIIGDIHEVQKVMSSIKGEYDDGSEMQIDFNKIRRMPEGLKANPHSGIKTLVEITTGQVNFKSLFEGNKNESFIDALKASGAVKYLIDGNSIKNFSEEEFEIFIQCLKNIRDHGHTSWYEWSIENWGTKWNAYEQNDQRSNYDTIYFQTAWSAPIDLMVELSKTFPSVTLQLDYADEDMGSNTGNVTIKSGEIINAIHPESCSKEGYDIYFDLHPDSINDFRLVDGKYEYIDED